MDNTSLSPDLHWWKTSRVVWFPKCECQLFQKSKEGDVDQWRDKSNYVGLAHVSQRNVSNWSSRLRQEAKDVVGKHSRQNSRYMFQKKDT